MDQALALAKVHVADKMTRIWMSHFMTQSLLVQIHVMVTFRATMLLTRLLETKVAIAQAAARVCLQDLLYLMEAATL